MTKNDYSIAGSLTYGRLLKKYEERLLIFLIAISIGLALLFILFSPFAFDSLVGKILVPFSAVFVAFIFTFISLTELRRNEKNKNFIDQSASDAVLLKATSKVSYRDAKSRVILSVSFRYLNKKLNFNSEKCISIGRDFQDGDIDILYSPITNGVLFLK